MKVMNSKERKENDFLKSKKDSKRKISSLFLLNKIKMECKVTEKRGWEWKSAKRQSKEKRKRNSENKIV